ncbi:MAG: UDP binding domain-containing protein [Methanocella sp.]
MSPALFLKPIEVDTYEKRAKYSVAIIGCGRKGIFLANSFANAGFNVICTDADIAVVKKTAKGRTAFGRLETEEKLKEHIAAEKIDVTSDLKKAVAQSDIVVIAFSAKLDDQKNDSARLVNTCKRVGTALRHGALVICCGIVGLGFIEDTIKKQLENSSGLEVGKDFGLAYNPILDTTLSISDLQLRVAATDQASLKSAATILKTLTSKIRQINDLRTAEAATLFAVAKRNVTTALANEIAVFCENANIDYYKVLDTLNLNHPEFHPTIEYEDNKNEATLLLEDAENLNVKLRLTALAHQVNEDMVRYALNLTQEGLRSCDKTLRRAKVAVLGQVLPKSGAFLYVQMLEQKGAKVTLYGSKARKDMQTFEGIKTSLNSAVEGADCIVVVAGKEQMGNLNFTKLKALVKAPAVLVDLAGTFERAQVEEAGFKYCGLGKGN